MIIKTIDEWGFKNAFEKMGRENNFSDYGLSKIFEYQEMFSEECGEDIELDVIAICCDYTEYNSLEELRVDYENIECREDLEYYTQIICYKDDCIIIASY